MASDNGWREVLLEDVSSEMTVGFVGPMTHEYVSEGIPFLRSKNVKPYGIDFNDIRYITAEFHNRIRKSTLVPGNVVIVRTGKPGATAVIPNSLAQANCSDLVIVRPGPALNERFLCYYINTVAAHHVNAHLVGAVQQHFNVGSARQIRIRLPSRKEQDAIAGILGALDDKIELNRRMNETLEAMARAIFKSWFVDFDPVRAKLDGRQPPGMDADTAALFPDHFEHTELGLVPNGWPVQRWGDIATLEYGKSLRGYKDASGPYRVFGPNGPIGKYGPV
ncbi:MAG: restriction endonuclease subunit S [Planctomycetes bacterium]|nr:restriction endonuclease subunit S [Planctomycetota bacterium]